MLANIKFLFFSVMIVV